MEAKELKALEEDSSDGTNDGDGQDVYALAERLGVEVFEADEYHLQIDLDKGDTIRDNVLDFLSRRGIIRPEPDSILVTRSRSGKGRHWYIPLLSPMSFAQRIAYQAALGSDPMREARSLYHYNFGTRQVPQCLFETPKEAVRVDKWLSRWIPRRLTGVRRPAPVRP